MKMQKIVFSGAAALLVFFASCASTGGAAVSQPVEKYWDFKTPATTPVEGVDYQTVEGSWNITENGLDFDIRPGKDQGEVKLMFLDSVMANGRMDIEIEITGTYSNEGGGTTGNAGLILHGARFYPGTDTFDGYYVGVGTGKAATQGNYHFESSWYNQSWHDLWNDENTNIPANQGPFTLSVTVINDGATAVIYDRNGNEVRSLDGNTGDGRGAPPASGIAGLRVWNARGTIHSIRITNVGEGLDFATGVAEAAEVAE